MRCARKFAIELFSNCALPSIMTILAKCRKSHSELILLSVVSLAVMILSGCASAPTPGSTRPEPAVPFIKVARTSNGYFFQRGTNLFYSLGVCVVIPEETWPDRPEFAKRKALGSYDGLSRFGSDQALHRYDGIVPLAYRFA